MKGRIRKTDLVVDGCVQSSRKREELYGHLSPPYIMEELKALAQCVAGQTSQADTDLEGRLSGLTSMSLCHCNGRNAYAYVCYQSMHHSRQGTHDFRRALNSADTQLFTRSSTKPDDGKPSSIRKLSSIFNSQHATSANSISDQRRANKQSFSTGSAG